VLAAEARLSGFGGRQAGMEVAPKTLEGRGVGLIGRADKLRFDGFVEPGARPLVQALRVYKRYVFRHVEHSFFDSAVDAIVVNDLADTEGNQTTLGRLPSRNFVCEFLTRDTSRNRRGCGGHVPRN
jgi:hypothetical protein